jgi:hypothetical protein
MESGEIKNPAAVLSWLKRNAKRLKLDPDDFLTRNRVLWAAVRAQDVGDDPGGLFVQIVRERLWENITDDQMATAKSLLAEHDGQSAALETVAALASGLGADR